MNQLYESLPAGCRSGADALREARKLVLAYRVGAGVEHQYMAALPAGEDCRAVVVAPPILREHVAKRIEDLRPDLRASVISRKEPPRWPEPGEVVVQWADHLLDAPDYAPEGLTAVVLEAHLHAHAGAKRYRRVRAFVRHVLSTGGRAWGVTCVLPVAVTDLWHVLQVFGLGVEAFGSFDAFRRLSGATYEHVHGVTRLARLSSIVPSDEFRKRLDRAVFRFVPEPAREVHA